MEFPLNKNADNPRDFPGSVGYSMQPQPVGPRRGPNLGARFGEPRGAHHPRSEEGRVKAAARLAEKTGAIVVLKGKGTVVMKGVGSAIELEQAFVNLIRNACEASQTSQTVTVTASVAAFGSLPIDPLYSATKHALVGFVRSIASANAHRGVRINVICPGVVDTAIVPDSFRDPATIMPPDELAAEVVDLLLHGGNGEVRAKLGGKPAFEVPVIDVLSGDGAMLARLDDG